MPPAGIRDPEVMTSVSDVVEEDTGRRTAEYTRDNGETDSIENHLKDKYFNIENSYEYESLLPQATPNVVGRLKSRLAQWELMGASDFILDTLRTGYKLPLIDTPPPRDFKNNKSALRNRDFVDSAIDELLQSGRILKLDSPPKIVNPLSVSENGAKKRLILDLRYVNLHLWKQRIKFEDFKTFNNFVKKGAYMFHFDFRSGYHHIDIFPEHWTFLGFSWTKNGITSYYCFIVLPFGLSTAPYIFTKVCRVLVKFWRSNGIKIVLFIDDGIGVENTFSQCKLVSTFVKNSIDLSGFLANEEKSNWGPIQVVTWLGLVIDTHRFVLRITDKRTSKVLDKINRMKRKLVASARQISAIAGSVISQTIVLGPVTGLFTREMYRFIARCRSWDSKSEIPSSVFLEFNFWLDNLLVLNERSLGGESVPVCVSCNVNSDASGSACAAILKIDDNIHTSHKNFSPVERVQSSTWRELEAVSFTLRSFAPLLQGRTVNWETDNQAVASITTKGSKKEHLQCLAVRIYFLCKRFDINLNINWIPRDKNVVADEISKFVDFDDWTTSTTFFRLLDSSWGPFTIDRFANHKNAKTPRYNALFWNPACEAVDAFTQDWDSENNWLVPPIFLIPRALRHAKACHAYGTLIAPLWESAPFWPIICNRKGSFRSFVREWRIFDNIDGLLQLGDCKQSLLGSDRFKSPLVAIRFQF